jgi:hypothetical protein
VKSILIYNLFPKTRWKEITRSILGAVPHDSIAVHISLPPHYLPILTGIKEHLRDNFPKIHSIFWSYNSRKLGESRGFNVLRKHVDFSEFDIVTYAHSKGSSSKRKHTDPVRDWTELMRYFVIERHDLCTDAFEKGMELYGVNLQPVRREDFPEITFHYSGTFVSCNLGRIREKFLSAPCAQNYFGVEMFWGSLTDLSHAACAHSSDVNHYDTCYPPARYR